MSNDGELMNLMREEIRSGGPMTFARYMELALYHPQLGFYRHGKRFGVDGDFYTAEQLTAVFGDVLSAFVEKLTMRPALRDGFAILELGAGRADLKTALSRWNYRAFDWDAAGLPETFTGLVLANEFFDALPVHLLIKRGNGWRELLVGLKNDGIGFVEEAPVSAEVMNYALDYGDLIPDGGRLEACLELPAWCEKISSLLTKGQLLVIDYGYETRELLRFPEGSLMTYRKHHAGSDPLADPGERDITAHVHFNWLTECAQASGLTMGKSSSLSHWVVSQWNEEQFQERWKSADTKWRLQWKHLVYGLGETFKVMQFEKGQLEK